MDMGKGEGRVRCIERVTWKHITVCKIDIQKEFAVWLRKLKEVFCLNLEEWDGEGYGREFQNGGYICIPMTNSC